MKRLMTLKKYKTHQQGSGVVAALRQVNSSRLLQETKRDRLFPKCMTGHLIGIFITKFCSSDLQTKSMWHCDTSALNAMVPVSLHI